MQDVNIQTKTFINWFNHLQPSNRIDNLAVDCSDGIKIVNLLETIFGLKLPRYHKVAKEKFQRVYNYKAILTVLGQQGILTVNGIEAFEFVDGNPAAIAKMFWGIILKYQVKASEGELLSWAKSFVSPLGATPTDFTQSWADGKVLLLLITSLNPKLNITNLKDKVQQVQECLNIAHENFNIPKLIDAQDVVNNPDALSIQTYVSFFRDYAVKNNIAPPVGQGIPEKVEEKVVEKQVEKKEVKVEEKKEVKVEVKGEVKAVEVKVEVKKEEIKVVVELPAATVPSVKAEEKISEKQVVNDVKVEEKVEEKVIEKQVEKKEVKVEEKKEVKVEVKGEVKAVPPAVPQEKVEENIVEKEVEITATKKEDVKVEVKEEVRHVLKEEKLEVKSVDVKVEVKPETNTNVKEEIKVDKKEAVKVDVVTKEVVTKQEPKVVEKQEAPKVEVKKQETPKVDVKQEVKEEKKVDVKVDKTTNPIKLSSETIKQDGKAGTVSETPISPKGKVVTKAEIAKSEVVAKVEKREDSIPAAKVEESKGVTVVIGTVVEEKITVRNEETVKDVATKSETIVVKEEAKKEEIKKHEVTTQPIQKEGKTPEVQVEKQDTKKEIKVDYKEVQKEIDKEVTVEAKSPDVKLKDEEKETTTEQFVTALNVDIEKMKESKSKRHRTHASSSFLVPRKGTEVSIELSRDLSFNASNPPHESAEGTDKPKKMSKSRRMTIHTTAVDKELETPRKSKEEKKEKEEKKKEGTEKPSSNPRARMFALSKRISKELVTSFTNLSK